MESETIDNFSEFVNLVETIGSSSSGLILYRGQAKKGNLLPSIARQYPRVDSTNKEKGLLRELRRMGTSILPRDGMNDWELLVLAQHFGMKTRLLDWTSNPMAALWFACNDSQKGDVYVYLLDADEFLHEPDKGPFDGSKTLVFRPSLNNPRIIAQHGWFTAHKYSKNNRKFVALENNKQMKKAVIEIHFPEASRKPLLSSLDRNGVNSRTLFPDLEGLCKYLTWKHEIA